MRRRLTLVLFLAFAVCLNGQAQQAISPAKAKANLRKFFRDNALARPLVSPAGDCIGIFDGDKFFRWDLGDIDSGYLFTHEQSTNDGFHVLSPDLAWHAAVYAPYTPGRRGSARAKRRIT